MKNHWLLLPISTSASASTCASAAFASAASAGFLCCFLLLQRLPLLNRRNSSSGAPLTAFSALAFIFANAIARPARSVQQHLGCFILGCFPVS
jgi:hypothetical protein